MRHFFNAHMSCLTLVPGPGMEMKKQCRSNVLDNKQKWITKRVLWMANSASEPCQMFYPQDQSYLYYTVCRVWNTTRWPSSWYRAGEGPLWSQDTAMTQDWKKACLKAYKRFETLEQSFEGVYSVLPYIL